MWITPYWEIYSESGNPYNEAYGANENEECGREVGSRKKLGPWFV